MLGIFAKTLQTATRNAPPAARGDSARADLQWEARRQTYFLGRPAAAPLRGAQAAPRAGR